MENNAEVRAVMRQARILEESGSWDEAIRFLTKSNKHLESGLIETHLVELRHIAFHEIGRSTPASLWPKPLPDHFPGVSSVPEIPRSDLSVELVSSAIQHHGSIIVRGLFDPGACEVVRNCIDEAFAGVKAVTGLRKFDPTPWYKNFAPQSDKGYDFDPRMRYFVTFGFGVLAVDSPRALYRYLDCLSETGFDKFLYEYFGERPALSAKKSTLRRTPPDAVAGWHQDGGYFRTDTRAVNLWAAFSSCGVDAPSIDIFAKRFDTFVERGRSRNSWRRGQR